MINICKDASCKPNFEPAFSAVLLGASGSGKTTLLKHILQNYEANTCQSIKSIKRLDLILGSQLDHTYETILNLFDKDCDIRLHDKIDEEIMKSNYWGNPESKESYSMLIMDDVIEDLIKVKQDIDDFNSNMQIDFQDSKEAEWLSSLIHVTSRHKNVSLCYG